MALHKPIPIHFTQRSVRKTDPHASALLENPIHFTGLLAVIFPHMGTAGNPNLAMGRQSAEGKNVMKCKKMLFSKSSFHLSEPQSCCMPFCLQVWMAALIAAEPSHTSLRSRSLTKTVSIQATALLPSACTCDSCRTLNDEANSCFHYFLHSCWHINYHFITGPLKFFCIN